MPPDRSLCVQHQLLCPLFCRTVNGSNEPQALEKGGVAAVQGCVESIADGEPEIVFFQLQQRRRQRLAVAEAHSKRIGLELVPTRTASATRLTPHHAQRERRVRVRVRVGLGLGLG